MHLNSEDFVGCSEQFKEEIKTMFVGSEKTKSSYVSELAALRSRFGLDPAQVSTSAKIVLDADGT